MSDESWMREALEEAKNAFARDEVPVGSVIVFEGKIIARSSNCVEERRDATCHAEFLAIQEASTIIGGWRLTGCTLYSTLEPCSMCAGAMQLARVDRLVWGAPDLRHGAGGSHVDLFKKRHPTHQVEVLGGVLAEESAKLMRDFFKLQRERKV